MYTEKDYKKNIDALNIGTVLTIVFYFIGLCFLFSCTTERKATGYFDKNKDKAANYCAVNFPTKDSVIIKDSTHFDTVQGAIVYVYDTILQEGKTIIKALPCPPVQTITKYQHTKETIYQKNTAELYALNSELQVAQNTIDVKDGIIAEKDKQIQELEGKVKDKNKQLWYYRFTLLILLLWIFRRPLLNLINPIKL